MSQGGLGVWKVSPIFKGIGYATTVMAFWLNSYYIVVLAWALYYFVMSFNSILPWTTCNNPWNTENCVETFDVQKISNISSNVSVLSTDEFWQYKPIGFIIYLINSVFKKIFLFRLNVLRQSDSMSNIGSIRWELAVCLAVSWIVCYFCIWKGDFIF